MAYSAVYVFGDSLVNSGNALELAETVNGLPFTALPDGAPTASLGYYDGRFSDGFTFADLISNKYVGATSKDVFPFGFEDPFLGLSWPFASEPNGKALNWAYGGAQIIQGTESVPDLDKQTDAYRDAVDGVIDPNALHIFTIGGNDVRDLVPSNGGAITSQSTANAMLQAAATELFAELEELIAIGAKHLLITGIPDVGIIPAYNGLADEATRRAVATQYSDLLDGLIQQRVAQLQAAHPGVEIRYVSFDAAIAGILPNLAAVYGSAAVYPVNQSDLLFFDHVHPTAQAHALLAASFLDSTNPAGPAGEVLPLINPTMKLSGSIAAVGEVDSYTVSLIGGRNYTFDLRGVSSSGGSLADPLLTITDLAGNVIAQNDDGGLGLDSHLGFTAPTTGDYRIKLGAVGTLSGTYVLDILSSDGLGDNVYTVTDASRLIIEGVGQGFDRILATVSYVLNAGAEVEWLATTSNSGTGAINLTGNEFAQRITGNAGPNILKGGGGADILVGLGGNDSYIIDAAGITIVEAAGGGTDTVESSISYVLGAEIEKLTLTGATAINGTGNSLPNTITGNAAANILDGGPGADTLIGGPGNDTYRVDNAGDTVVESSGGGTDVIEASVSYTLPDRISVLTLVGSAPINATGNGGDNNLTGNSGNNVLNGMDGSDTMTGGLGNDTYVVGSSGDRVVEAANGGTDLVQSKVSHTLGDNVENLELTGTNSVNATGNGLANQLLGNSAGNTLDGGAGADLMDGAGGSDTYIVDNAGDVASETSSGGGTDIVKSSVTHTLGANIENLTLTGLGSKNGTGNALANKLEGNDDPNILFGLDGADTIDGNRGADKLYGGLGNDTLKGGNGLDIFVFDSLLGPANVDRISDFSVADDTIWLSRAIFSALPALGTLSASAFRKAPLALDSDDRIMYDSSNGKLYYDADGNGAGAAVQIATLDSGLSLTSADFFVI